MLEKFKQLLFLSIAISLVSCSQNQNTPPSSNSSFKDVAISNTEAGNLKMSVIYYSRSGNTRKMADVIVEGAQSVGGVEVKAFSIDKVDEDFVRSSQCVILGTPTYMSGMSSELLTWLQFNAPRLKMSGKLAGGFSTAGFVDGGGDIAIQNIIDRLLVLGTMVYSGGTSNGRPGIHLGPVSLDVNSAESHEMFTVYGQRMVEKTKDIFR